MKARYRQATPLLLFGILLGLLAGGGAAAGVIPRDVSLAPVVKETTPAVVNIATRGRVQVQRNPLFQDPMFRRFFGAPDEPTERETTSLGSGVIVDAAAGYVLTNYHVVENAEEITVNLVDGREYDAEIVGTDEASDLAVLQIEADELTALPFGDSDALEVGDYVLAVGNPFGLSHTVTSGIVSAKGRSGLNVENYEDFIQTDAAINRGNSGGALVNLQGELIGVNTAILGPAGGNVGIGFAIPSRMAQEVMSQILEYGSVQRGLLGVYGQELTANLARALGLDRPQGALITQVQPGSGAAEAGLRESDVIIEADGREVNNFNDLRNIVGLKRPGEKVELVVLRDGRRRTVEATLTQRDGTPVAASDGRPQRAEAFGLTVGSLPEDHPLQGEVEGVIVTDVARGSAAAREGLRPGDVITSVEREEISTVERFDELTEGRDRILLKVRRGEAAFFAVIE